MNDFTRLYVVLVIIPLAAIFVPALLTWAKDLSADARRTRQLSEQSQIVSFWDNWMKTVASVTPNDEDLNAKTERLIRHLKSEARHSLADAGQDVVTLYRSAEYRDFKTYKMTYAEFRKYRAALPVYRRLLLLYKAPNPWAKLYAGGFHFGVLLIVSMPIVLPLKRIFRSKFVFPEPHLVALFISAHPIFSLVLFWVYMLGLIVVQRQRAIRYENQRELYPRDRIFERYYEGPTGD